MQKPFIFFKVNHIPILEKEKSRVDKKNLYFTKYYDFLYRQRPKKNIRVMMKQF